MSPFRQNDAMRWTYAALSADRSHLSLGRNNHELQYTALYLQESTSQRTQDPTAVLNARSRNSKYVCGG
jgi:RES domain-containing protein